MLISHPIQYFAPVFRELSAISDMDLTVLYCSRQGVEERVDPKFGVSFAWDIPLLDGYGWKFVDGGGADGVAGRTGACLAVAREVLRGAYDALIVHGYARPACWAAFAAAAASRTPFLIRGESHLLDSRSLWRRLVKGVPLRALLRAARGYLAIGTRSAQYAAHYGMPECRIAIAPYCIDNRFFADGADAARRNRARELEALGLPAEALVFGFFGKIYQGKGCRDLLHAFRRIEAPGASLIFVGDGTDRAELEGYARSRGMENVRFVGFVNQSEVPRYQGLTDVLVLPSHAETWGLVVNEAMAAGCAVIVSDACGCAPDLVEQGTNGFTYPAGDVDALAELMARFLHQEGLAAEMGDASRRIIRDWSPAECARRIAEAVRRVCAGGGGG
jgi:glycosyltransferase involved in cell wall biosynthesis